MSCIAVDLCPGCAYREADDDDGLCGRCRSELNVKPEKPETPEQAARRRAQAAARVRRWRAAHPKRSH